MPVNPLALHDPQRAIDYDRGVVIRTHKDLNMDVFMYVDEPGVYLNAFGVQIGEEIAKQCGYDVVRHGRIRKMRLAQKAAVDAIASEHKLLEMGAEREVIKEINGFRAVHLGGGRHVIEDPEGALLTPGASLTEEVVLKVLPQVAGAVSETVPQPPDGGGRGDGATAGEPKRSK